MRLLGHFGFEMFQEERPGKVWRVGRCAGRDFFFVRGLNEDDYPDLMRRFTTESAVLWATDGASRDLWSQRIAGATVFALDTVAGIGPDGTVTFDDRAWERLLAGIIPPSPNPPDYTFFDVGDYFEITFAGKRSVVRKSAGLGYIRQLLDRPNQEIHITDLFGGEFVRTFASAQEVLDDEARMEYKKRLEELAADHRKAEANGDISWQDRINDETHQIAETLQGAIGLGGKSRTMGDETQNLRRRVTKTINETIARLEKQNQPLGLHLANSVNTGTFITYRPDQEIASFRKNQVYALA